MGFRYYFGMANPTDQKVTAIEKTVCYIHRYAEKSHAALWLGGHPKK